MRRYRYLLGLIVIGLGSLAPLPGTSAVDAWAASPAVQAEQWTRIDNNGEVGAPPARSSGKSVWDTQGNRLLLFGGEDGSGHFNDLWEYRTSGGWRLLTPNGAPGSPSARVEFAAEWDSQSSRLLIFGGRDSNDLYLNDFWEYTAARGWALITAQGNGSSPSPRTGPAIAWDSDAGRLLMFGGNARNDAQQCDSGVGGRTTFRNDLWQYSSGAGWQLLNDYFETYCSVAPGLYPRSGHSAVWDSQSDRLLVFGGVVGGLLELDDLWQYSDAGGWTVLARFRNSPLDDRAEHTAVWDDQANRMLIFGGHYQSQHYNDLWQYSTSTGFTLLTGQGATGAPELRARHAASWDSQSGRMLVFGGGDTYDLAASLNDLWQYGPPIVDRDRDGVLDPDDNCPDIANPGQANSDADGSGDACDEATFGGFSGPVDGPPVVNVGKAGRTYAVQWTVGGSTGAPVETVAGISVTYKGVSCGSTSGDPTDALEAEAAGSAGLRYDSVSEVFIYNWKTPRKPGCYELYVNLSDRGAHVAMFNLR